MILKRMNNCLILLIIKSLFVINLFAYESNDLISLDFSSIENNDSSKVSFDCSSYEVSHRIDIFGVKLFKYKRYFLSPNLNDLMNDLCLSKDKENKRVITYKELEKFISSYEYINLITDSNYNLINKKKIDEKVLTKQEGEFFVALESEWGKYEYAYAPFISFEKDTKLIFKIKRVLVLTNAIIYDKYQEFSIKDFNYDEKDRKIIDIKFRQLFNFKSKKYTNTYNIDDEKECIDGSIWIKKYGARSGYSCDWIDKDNSMNNKSSWMF